MKRFYKYSILFIIGISVCPTGCTVPFEPPGVKDTGGILVVEGMILEKGTTVKLSRTAGIYTESDPGMKYVYNADIKVIDDANNIVAVAELQNNYGTAGSVYKVIDEITFTPETKYALLIQIGEKKYQSSFVSPVMTPEIDEITWKQNDDRSMDIMVSTHDPEGKVAYYCWTFEEDWEYRAQEYGTYRYEPTTGEIIEQSIFSSADNRYYCWDSDKSKSIIVGASDKLTETTIKNRVIHNFPSNNSRFSYLYSIFVKQYAIDKETYTYFDNLKKNIEQSGSLFGPMLSEIRGNITCLSDPDEPVLGYIFASSEVSSRFYIDMEKIDGEDIYNCNRNEQGYVVTYRFTASELEYAYRLGLGIHYELMGMYYCLQIKCLDCTLRGGTKNKPDFWPNDHL